MRAPAEWQLIRCLDYTGVPYIKGRSPVIGFRVQRVRDECGRVCSHAGVQTVTVIQCFRERVHAAELQTIVPMMIHVDFKTVVRANPFGEPMCRVPDGTVAERSAHRIVKRSSWITCGAEPRGAHLPPPN